MGVTFFCFLLLFNHYRKPKFVDFKVTYKCWNKCYCEDKNINDEGRPHTVQDVLHGWKMKKKMMIEHNQTINSPNPEINSSNKA